MTERDLHPLTECREEDVSKTMYRETTAARTTETTSRPADSDLKERTTGKVNGICRAFVDVFLHCHSINVQNIITAHVCMIPPNLKAGLELVGKLRCE